MTNDSKSVDDRNGGDESTNASQDRQSQVTRRGFIASTAGAAGLLWTGAPALADGADTDQGGAARSTRSWANLRRRIKGEVITADAPDFVAVRNELVWNNIKPSRSPDVIVRVKDEDDVVEAVNFA